MVKLNKAQQQALKAVYQREPLGISYRAFRKTVLPGWGYILVPWAGMVLGIEKDGHTHS